MASSTLSRRELIDGIQTELTTYLRSGTINTSVVAAHLSYEGLDVDEWERLKRIHFCLSEPVREFVDAVPEWIRSIRTAHERDVVTTRGEIRGAVDWGQTLKLQSETGYRDRTQFACSTPYTEYDIPENRVVKRLLAEVYATVSAELAPIEYEWRRARWSDEAITQFSQWYRRNVHLERIPTPDGPVPSRALTAARTARSLLYTEAYDLLDRYERLRAGAYTDSDIQQVLRETTVVPQHDDRLFELYCVFRLLQGLTETFPELELQPIESGRAALATLRGPDTRIEVYHDQTGSLSFYEPLAGVSRPQSGFYQRYHDAELAYSSAATSLLDIEPDSALYQGRPDIVCEIYDRTQESPRLQRVVIGEIKRSLQQQTIKQGLHELVQYRHFARHNADYLRESEIPVYGLLVTDETSPQSPEPPYWHLAGATLASKPTDATLQALLTSLFDGSAPPDEIP